jgi:hypothetical protein
MRELQPGATLKVFFRYLLLFFFGGGLQQGGEDGEN